MANEKTDERLSAELEQRFQSWWSDDGSCMAAKPDEEDCCHVERVSRIAFVNGAFVAMEHITELTAELLRLADEMLRTDDDAMSSLNMKTIGLAYDAKEAYRAARAKEGWAG